MSTRYLLACVLLLSVAACWGQQQPTFNYQTLPNAGLVVSGDFNRDGWPDLAIVYLPERDGDPTLNIYLGIGDGNFNLVNTYTLSTYPSQLLTADMNGDGILDLVFPTNGVSIYYGAGNGNFSLGKTVPVLNPYGIQLSDVNGDGRIDIVSLSNVMLNKGNGVFTSVSSPHAGQSLLIDVNGDGKVDSVSYDSYSGKGLVVSKGLGTGQFAAPYYTGGKEPVLCIDAGNCNNSTEGMDFSPLRGFVLGDFYSLGHLDLAVLVGACDWNIDPNGVACAEALYIYKNSGSGTFSLAHSYKFTGGARADLFTADLNNDQKQDIVVYSTQTGEALFFMGNGNGTFASPVGLSAPVGQYQQVMSPFTRDLGLTSRQDIVMTVAGPAGGGQDTAIALNTTPVTNCQPPNSSKLAAHICSPIAGASPKTVVVKGSGNSPAGVQRLEVWIDGVKKGQSLSDQINKAFTLTTGSHRVALIAVDKYKGTAKSTVYVTVP